MKVTNMDEVVCISDSDDEAVPSPVIKPSTQQLAVETNSTSSMSDTVPSLNSAMLLFRPPLAPPPSGALSAVKKKKLSAMNLYPAVRDVILKMRSVLGSNNCQSRVMDVAQQYICSLKYYQAKIYKCPNRCRMLAKHITHTMFLLRDLSRHFFDSPHYTQKMCELLAIYIYFELQSADDFKDSKIKIAERIIHNIHVHLDGGGNSNFMLRIFAYIPNMGKENEIVTKIFQRIIPEPAIVVKNEFNDRLFIQYLIAFYHWKEAWTDYEDQQKVITFANKFMKPMITIKSNKLYAKHLPCYAKREDATGYFLTNLVFFNDLRNASIMDGIQDNGPQVVDLSGDDKTYSPLDLSVVKVQKIIPLLNNIKLEEPQVVSDTVDLTDIVDDPLWLRRLVLRANEEEFKLPPRLNPALHVYDDKVIVIPADDDNVEMDQRREEPPPAQEQAAAPRVEESNSMDSIYNQMDSSMDFCDDSTTESENIRRREHIEAENRASNDPDRRLTFAGIIEKELKSFSLSLQLPTTSKKAIEAAKNLDATDSSAQKATFEKTKDANNTSVATQTKIAPLANEKEKQTEQVAVEENELPATINNEPINNSKNDRSLTITTTTEVPKEAVTLNIDKLTSSFDSSDESDDTLFGGYKRPPLKTYLRRSFKRSPSNKNKTSSQSLTFSSVGAGSEPEEENDTVPQNKKNGHFGVISTEKKNDNYRERSQPEKPTTNKKVLFSGKVISLREDDHSNGVPGGATPSYLKVPDSVEVSPEGSNVVFSMQGRRLSSFPSLRVSSTDQSVPDFDLDSAGEDNNESEEHNRTSLFQGTKSVEKTSSVKPKSVVEPTNDKPKSIVESTSDKSVLAVVESTSDKTKPFVESTSDKLSSSVVESTCEKLKESKAEKPPVKSKNVSFAEKAEVHEIERLEAASPSPQKISSINSINSTINKTNLTKQLLTTISSSSTSTPPVLLNSFELNKHKLLPTVVKRSNPITTESSEETAVLKKGQLQALYQSLFYNVGKPNQVEPKGHSTENNELIKATRASFTTIYNTNKNNMLHRTRNYPKAISEEETTSEINSCKKRLSEFDRYLMQLEKKHQRRNIKKRTKKSIESGHARRSSNISVKKSVDVAPVDPKLNGQENPVVTLDQISGPVLIIKEDTYTEIIPGVFKLKSPSPPILPSPTPQPVKIIVGDSLPDVIEKEVTTVSISKDQSSALDETVKTPGAIIELAAGSAEKQLDIRPCSSPAVDVQRSLLPEEKEKEETGKVEGEEVPVQSSLVTVKSQYEMDLKIKKEELESKSPSPEVLAQSRQVSDCFKKPFKYATTKRLASSSFIHGNPRSAAPYKDATPVGIPVRKEVGETSSADVLDRLGGNDSDSSSNRNNLPPITNESESDLSLKTAPTPQETDIVNQPQSSPKRQVKVRLKRHNIFKDHLEYSIISNSVVDEINQKATEKCSVENVGKKRRRKKSWVKKGEALKRIFERTEATTKGFEQSPQERSINGVVVPNIESLNTPPPTPPTTIDDKSSVTDDSSQDSKTQKSDPLLRRPSEDLPSIIRHVDDNVHTAIDKSQPITSEVPATNESCKGSYNDDTLPCFLFPQGNSHLLDSNSLRHYRQKFENSLPSANQKRPRKHSIAEDWKGSSIKNIPKKRRKTICSDVFNFSDYSLDEDICSANATSESPTIEVMKIHSLTRLNNVKSLITSSRTVEEAAPSLIRPSNVGVLSTFEDFSLAAQTLSENSTPVHSENMENDRSSGSFSSSTTSRTNCDSPLEATSRNMAVSRTYSKSNMVQQIFVPPEIEMFIEEPTNVITEKTTAAILPVSSPSCLTKHRTSRIVKTNKTSGSYKKSEDEDCEDDIARDEDYQRYKKRAKKKSTRGRKKGAIRGRRQ